MDILHRDSTHKQNRRRRLWLLAVHRTGLRAGRLADPRVGPTADHRAGRLAEHRMLLCCQIDKTNIVLSKVHQLDHRRRQEITTSFHLQGRAPRDPFSMFVCVPWYSYKHEYLEVLRGYFHLGFLN